MSSHLLRSMGFLGLAALTLLAGSALADDGAKGTKTAAAAHPISTGELAVAAKRGRAIYHRGEGEGAPIQLVLSSSDLELPASAFPCSNCHGTNGEGTEEGGVAPPAIRWRDLFAAGRSPLTDRERIAYDRTSLGRAITEGVDPAGQPLHPGMPRYRLTPEQLDDLIAYLEVIDTPNDLDPGITPDSIRLGCFLPFEGPRGAGGDAVRRALDAYFGDLSDRGGVYGRRIEMVYVESGSDDASATAAAKKLIEEEEVFALIASFVPIEATELYRTLAEARVPFLGPLTIPPRPELPPDRYVFQLLSGHYDQARVLVEFAATSTELPRTGYSLIWLDDQVHRDARDGVIDQVGAFGGALSTEIRYEAGEFEAESAVAQLIETKTEAVFVFGAQPDILAFAHAAEVAGFSGPLLTNGSTIGRAAFDLPEAIARRTYLTYPSSQPTRKQLEWVLRLATEAELRIDHPTQQGPALAAARIFVEGVKRTGTRLGREAWIDAMEELQFFETGLVPSVSFGLNQRTGALGAYVMRLDPEAKSFVPMTPWITPRAPIPAASLPAPAAPRPPSTNQTSEKP